MIPALTSIWQDAFQRPSIGVNENFFELGGTPALARRITSEISKTSDKFLAAELIYQAPTIASLAALLSQTALPALKPTVLLKPGSEVPPVFIAHGLGGSVFEFFGLVRLIATRRPVFGLQARGGDGVKEPFTRIEDSARYFIDAIRSVQPQGPYFLMGHSLGGLVVLEIAQQLSAHGDSVALVGMMDSYPHQSQLAVGQKIRLAARGAHNRVQSAIWPIPVHRMELFARGPGRLAARASLEIRLRARNSAQLAWEKYRPRFYPGKICFVRATTVTVYPENPVAVWKHLAGEFEMKTVPGDHHQMLTDHPTELADALSSFLHQLKAVDL